MVSFVVGLITFNLTAFLDSASCASHSSFQHDLASTVWTKEYINKIVLLRCCIMTKWHTDIMTTVSWHNDNCVRSWKTPAPLFPAWPCLCMSLLCFAGENISALCDKSPLVLSKIPMHLCSNCRFLLSQSSMVGPSSTAKPSKWNLPNKLLSWPWARAQLPEISHGIGNFQWENPHPLPNHEWPLGLMLFFRGRCLLELPISFCCWVKQPNASNLCFGLLLNWRIQGQLSEGKIYTKKIPHCGLQFAKIRLWILHNY